MTNDQKTNEKYLTISYDDKLYQIVMSENLLNDLIKCNIPVRKGCLKGICGTCKVKLLEGKVKYLVTPLAFLKKDEVLTCISSADADYLVIDL